MRVENVQSSQNFGMFRVKGSGAQKLAQDFIENPQLEKSFLKKIVAPLQKAKTEVVYDGYSTMYKHPNEDYYTSILHAFDDSYTVMPYGGPVKYSRNEYRSKNSASMEYTNEFPKYPYHELEAAKNIALDIEAGLSNKAAEAYKATKNYEVPELGNTLAEKFAALNKLFGMD